MVSIISKRNNELFSQGFLLDRWLKLEGDEKKADDIAKQTVMRALRRNPWNVLNLGLKTYLGLLDIRSWKKCATRDLGRNVAEAEKSQLINRFPFAAGPLSGKQEPTMLQIYFLHSYPYCLLVMMAPALAGAALLLRSTRRYCALMLLHASIVLAVATIVAPWSSVRYVQPLSLLTLLIFAVFAKALADRRSFHASPA